MITFQKVNMIQILTKNMIQKLQSKKLIATCTFSLVKTESNGKKDPPAKNVRTRFENIVTRCETTVLKFRVQQTVFDHFPDESMGVFVKSTNYYIASVKRNSKRDMDAIDTNTAELIILFGLLYYSEMLREGLLNAKDLGSSDCGVRLFFQLRNKLTLSIFF